MVYWDNALTNGATLPGFQTFKWDLGVISLLQELTCEAGVRRSAN